MEGRDRSKVSIPGPDSPLCRGERREKNSDAALAGGMGNLAGELQIQPAVRRWPIPLFPWRKTQTRALVISDGSGSWIISGAQGRGGEKGSGLGVAVRSNDCPRLQTVSPSGKGGTSHPRSGFPASRPFGKASPPSLGARPGPNIFSLPTGATFSPPPWC